ncbi:MAG: 1-deoxy-D-xylulose-5-phosphate synthase [bacterium]
MSSVLAGIGGPDDLRRLDDEERAVLCAEIRDFLIDTVARTGGHLGPNLGVVELTVALHTVFHSPVEPILFDTGHQAYVHKILTGRSGGFDRLKQAGGLSGYPNRAESPHDWIENSHASTALSWADGLAKAFDVRGDRRPVVAVVGDGALTGGMCWEALNNIAGSDRPVVIVVNDNGRSYAPTIGGLAERLAGLRLRPGYEKVLGTVRERLQRTPLVGPAVFDALHGVKRGMKDFLAPQGLFEDLGLKYLGPVDGHDLPALITALTLARNFGAPVIVHAVTRKGYGYPPAENDAVEQMHSPGAFDRLTGTLVPKSGRSWTSVFAEEIVAIGEARGDVVAITAAMCEPTGLGRFAQRFPDRFYDVGIAEQHALTSAAGLAAGGLHPVVALYATFLNRAYDQLLLDVALHRLPVTVVLDRAGLTGDDGASHNGMWDLALLGTVPGLREAAPRDEEALREQLAEAVEESAGPTVVRFPKTPLPADTVAVRRSGEVDVLAEPGPDVVVDVALVAVGATAPDVLAAAGQLDGAGFSVRVLDPRWVTPVSADLIDLASAARLVITVEDGLVTGGVGARLSQELRARGCDVPVREIGVPRQFLEHGKVADVRAGIGLTGPDISRRVVEWAVQVLGGDDLAEPVDAGHSRSARKAGERPVAGPGS